MDHQTQRAIIIVLLAIAVLIFHLGASTYIWRQRSQHKALLSLVALSALTYTVCWVSATVVIFMNGFPRQVEGRIDIATANWTFNLILNPCGRLPWLDEHLGPFFCGIAVVLFGPSVFFVMGLLPMFFTRRSTTSPLSPPAP